MDADLFAARLRELREERGWTQEELARRVGARVNTVGRWERGEREPSWRTLLELCEALGVDCTAFTGKPGPKGRGRKGRG